MNLVDTHCHLDVASFDPDRSDVIRRCHEAGVNRIVVPGIEVSNWGTITSLTDEYAGLFPAYGLHPVYLHSHDQSDISRLADYLADHPAVAVGEIGLDYYLEFLDRDRQKQLFRDQLEIAEDFNLPVILHVRKSHEDVLHFLKQASLKGGICHAFNGSLEQGFRYIELGFKLGFGGMLTYERSSKLRKLAKELPLESIVLETDAPDMTGKNHHGMRNSPEYLPEVLEILADLREESIEAVAVQTTANAETVFNLAERE